MVVLAIKKMERKMVGFIFGTWELDWARNGERLTRSETVRKT